MVATGGTDEILWKWVSAAAPWGHVALAAAWMGVGVFVYTEAQTLGLEGDFGPGPGFLLHYLALALIVLGALLTGQTVRNALRISAEGPVATAEQPAATPREKTRRALRFAGMAAALAVFPVLNSLTGLPVAVGVLIAITLLSHGVNIVRAVAGSLLLTGALVVVFHVFLGVPLF